MDFKRAENTSSLISQNFKRGVISTLSCPNLTMIRHNGNTTRQIDFAIQKLFEGYVVNVEDHATTEPNVSVGKINNRLFIRIMSRLKEEYEHNVDGITCHYIELSKVPKIVLTHKDEML